MRNCHKESLDNMSPSEIRVVLEHLLSTMEIKQRRNLMETFPGLYKLIYPTVTIVSDPNVRYTES